MGCCDRASSAPKLDHFTATIGQRRVVEHDEKINVGIRPVRPDGHGAEKNDAYRIELGNQGLHENIGPSAQCQP